MTRVALKTICVLLMISLFSCAQVKKGSMEESSAKKSGGDSIAVSFAKTTISEEDWNNYLRSYADYVVKGASQNTALRYGDIESAAEKLTKFYQEKAGWDYMVQETAKLYSEQFSDKELKKLIEFFQTPLGKKFKKKSQVIQGKTHTSFAERMSAFEQEHRKAITEALTK